VERYLGEFIAFEDGRVLDHDRNERDLVERVLGMPVMQIFGWVKNVFGR
jgi:hypothetical protein